MNQLNQYVMKVIQSSKFILLFLSFLGMTNISSAQTQIFNQAWITAYVHSKHVQQDNEFAKKTVDDTSDFYCNPLRLDGSALDYNSFTMNSRGILYIARGNPSTSK